MSHKKLILGFNWKSNPVSPAQSRLLFEKYLEQDVANNLEVIVFPPSLYLSDFYLNYPFELKFKKIKLGTQKIASVDSGTGFLTAELAHSVGAQYTIINHSETKNIYKISFPEIQKQIQKASSVGIKSIVCISYSKIENSHTQISEDLKDIFGNLGVDPLDIIVAFEPSNFIGTDNAMSVENIHHFVDFIRVCLNDLGYNSTKILYGGGINSKNIEELAQVHSLSGFLIGHSSLESDELTKIIAKLSHFPVDAEVENHPH